MEKKSGSPSEEKGRCTDRKRNVCERHPGIPENSMEREDLSEQRKGFAASVSYNLGCAYSIFLRWKRHRNVFWKSYREAHYKMIAIKRTLYHSIQAVFNDKTDYDNGYGRT